jgi:hypothetical protein
MRIVSFPNDFMEIQSFVYKMDSRLRRNDGMYKKIFLFVKRLKIKCGDYRRMVGRSLFAARGFVDFA